MPDAAGDSWLVQKLKSEWSSCDLGPLLTKERLADAVASFPLLDTPVKVRLLLAFLSMRKEDFEASKFAVVEIVDAAEKDHEEWVKVGAGIVNQYLFMSRDGAESGTFLHEHLARASAKVLEAVGAGDADSRSAVIEDFFCHENAYLSASVRPELALQPAAHFTIAEGAPNHGNRLSGVHSSNSVTSGSAASSSQSAAKHKPPTHRPQLTRPLGAAASGSATSVPARMAAQAPKNVPLPPKKNMSELSSEIRRKADAGRFKRQRSRISVIDLDEIKQIESEKAQKAEEQKKRLKATKEENKKNGVAGGGDAADAAGGHEDADKQDGNDGEHDGAHDEPTHESQYGELEDNHGSDHEEADNSFRTSHSGNASVGVGGYAQDGTQALLNAAFHSTGDVMKEVVSQQHQPYQQHDYYHRQASGSQQQPLYSNRGFEPEDAHSANAGYSGNPYGYGTGYGQQFGDQGPPFNDALQYPNNGGFGDDQGDQQQGEPRYDRSRDRGFLDGPPEYWR